MTADLKASPRVYVVDDDPGIRQTIRRLIEPMGLPVDEYSCVEQFLGAYDQRQAGCLVLDYQLEGISGIELLEYFARSGRGIPTIMITGAATTEIVVRAMKSGALTVLAKPFRHKELLQAIQDALKADSTNRIKRNQIAELQSRFSRLTDQERTVLRLVIAGMTNKEIARDLDVSLRTIESRRQQIFKKTGANSVGQLIWNAMLLRVEGLDWEIEHQLLAKLARLGPC